MARLSFSPDEWERLLDSTTVPSAVLEDLVAEWLVVHGHTDAARSLRSPSAGQATPGETACVTGAGAYPLLVRAAGGSRPLAAAAGLGRLQAQRHSARLSEHGARDSNRVPLALGAQERAAATCGGTSARLYWMATSAGLWSCWASRRRAC